jgi:hypothetical protein
MLLMAIGRKIEKCRSGGREPVYLREVCLPLLSIEKHNSDFPIHRPLFSREPSIGEVRRHKRRVGPIEKRRRVAVMLDQIVEGSVLYGRIQVEHMPSHAAQVTMKRGNILSHEPPNIGAACSIKLGPQPPCVLFMPAKNVPVRF